MYSIRGWYVLQKFMKVFCQETQEIQTLGVFHNQWFENVRVKFNMLECRQPENIKGGG